MKIKDFLDIPIFLIIIFDNNIRWFDTHYVKHMLNYKYIIFYCNLSVRVASNFHTSRKEIIYNVTSKRILGTMGIVLNVLPLRGK